MFEKLTEKLKETNFQVTCFEGAAEAAEYLDRTIDKKTVAIGGSHTVQEMGLYPLLESHNLIYYTASRKHSAEEKSLLWKASMDTEVYITSVNGLAEDCGALINIDGCKCQ